VGRKRYTASPDGAGAVLDADRGSGNAGTKLASVLGRDEAQERQENGRVPGILMPGWKCTPG